MPDCTALSIIDSSPFVPPEVDLGILRLWITPTEFLQTTHAMTTAAWAIRVSQTLTRRLPDPARRGPKIRYGENSILMMAFIQAAWQMGYEMTVDYFRTHPEAARALQRGAWSASANIGNVVKRWAPGRSGFSFWAWSGNWHA
ncbi:MAG: hypothetical protein HZB19_08050 [Chloroflexi bacterium]|nr:hypothetical protein [Chloroflexota bacterium]